MFKKYRSKRLCDLAKKDMLCFCGKERLGKGYDWCTDYLYTEDKYAHDFRSITNLELIGIINKL